VYYALIDGSAMRERDVGSGLEWLRCIYTVLRSLWRILWLNVKRYGGIQQDIFVSISTV